MEIISIIIALFCTVCFASYIPKILKILDQTPQPTPREKFDKLDKNIQEVFDSNPNIEPEVKAMIRSVMDNAERNID